MPNQIFKKSVPDNILFDFLSQITKLSGNYFYIDKYSFKKAVFLNIVDDFIAKLDEYYYSSKKHYIQRKINFNRFITILRQICKFNNIPITSEISYERSTYKISYFIYDNREK